MAAILYFYRFDQLIGTRKLDTYDQARDLGLQWLAKGKIRKPQNRYHFDIHLVTYMMVFTPSNPHAEPIVFRSGFKTSASSLGLYHENQDPAGSYELSEEVKVIGFERARWE